MRVGILGAGGMGNVHARQYRKMPDVELFFLDPDAERAQTFVARWQAEPVESIEDLVAKVDIVDICLPTDLHIDLGLPAIAAGRALFIEKPLARTLEDCRTLIEAADKAGAPLGVGHVVRYFPEFAQGHAIVVGGGVGKPAAARTRRGGRAPSGHQNWFMDHARSGGILLDLAIHDFDWLRWTLGEVTHLYARSLGAQSGSGPDFATTTLTFDCGAVAHVESTWMDPGGFRTTFEVAGSEGLIEFDSRLSPSLRTQTADGAVLESNVSRTDDPYYRELRGFVDAVASGTPPPVGGFDGFMAVSIALSALESARTGTVQRPSRG